MMDPLNIKDVYSINTQFICNSAKTHKTGTLAFDMNWCYAYHVTRPGVLRDMYSYANIQVPLSLLADNP